MAFTGIELHYPPPRPWGECVKVVLQWYTALLLRKHKNRRKFENSKRGHVLLFSAAMCSCFQRRRVIKMQITSLKCPAATAVRFDLFQRTQCKTKWTVYSCVMGPPQRASINNENGFAWLIADSRLLSLHGSTDMMLCYLIVWLSYIPYREY